MDARVTPRLDSPSPSAPRANGCAPATRRGHRAPRRTSISGPPAGGAIGEWCRGSRRGLTATVPSDGLIREAPTFVGIQTQSLALKPRFQRAVLFAEKRDHVLVFTLPPPAEHRQNEVKRKHGLKSTSVVPILGGHYIVALTRRQTIVATVRRSGMRKTRGSVRSIIELLDLNDQALYRIENR